MKIESTVQYQCGCGFLAKRQDEKTIIVKESGGEEQRLFNLPGLIQKKAIEHARQMGHALTVSGIVRPEGGKNAV
jgi:hypothetical protein